jgi:hypothetical protein
MSLLADVCDPPFLLSLLHNALERYLDANPSASGRSDNGGHDVGNTGGVVRAAGYTFALNAVGMCILHLPKEAVEVEAKRLSKEVVSQAATSIANSQCTAIADKHVHARQAGYAVMLAVQCILSDDVRTLALFPKLDSGQRSFATYLMENHRLLGRATSETEALARRESVHGELVGGLNKRQMK